MSRTERFVIGFRQIGHNVFRSITGDLDEPGLFSTSFFPFVSSDMFSISIPVQTPKIIRQLSSRSDSKQQLQDNKIIFV